MLTNLKKDTKDRIKSGDIVFLKKVLESELKASHEALVDIPEPMFKILQGQCRTLRDLIKLLP